LRVPARQREATASRSAPVNQAREMQFQNRHARIAVDLREGGDAIQHAADRVSVTALVEFIERRDVGQAIAEIQRAEKATAAYLNQGHVTGKFVAGFLAPQIRYRNDDGNSPLVNAHGAGKAQSCALTIRSRHAGALEVAHAPVNLCRDGTVQFCL